MSRRLRKRKLSAEDKTSFEWEKDRILPENLRDEMETMWEIPQIYHFLQLTKEALGITHLSMYEVERMLLMPRASKQLAQIMTGLLSSPSTIKTMQRVPSMPYEFWTNILMFKLKQWYQTYEAKHQNSVKIFNRIGIEPEFWKYFPNASAIDGKDFQAFSFRQRVWLLKTLCDTALHTRKMIQDEVGRQPWESQFETVLGVDRFGVRYLYFPQFLHNDLRVYKHCLDNEVLSTVRAPPPEEAKPKLEEEEEKKVEEKGVKMAPKMPRGRPPGKKRRKSRWSSGALPPKNKYKKKRGEFSSIDQSLIDSNSNSVDSQFCRSSRGSSKASELSSSSSFAKSSGYETNVSNEVLKDVVDDATEREGEEESKEVCEDEDRSTVQKTTTDLTFSKDSNFNTLDDLSKSSKTDDEKLEEMSSKNKEMLPDVAKDVNVSKSDDQKLSESKICDTTADTEVGENSFEKSWETFVEKIEDEVEGVEKEPLSSDLGAENTSNTRRSARIKIISEIKTEVEDAEDLVDVNESEELSSLELRDSLCRVSSPEEVDVNTTFFKENKWKVDNFNKLIADLSVSNFQLVADSIDSLRDLMEYITNDKTIPGHESTSEEFVRPKCEEKLLKRMRVLLKSLDNVEDILKESTKKARSKLQREWSNFENGLADDEEEGTNGWHIGSQVNDAQRQRRQSSPSNTASLSSPAVSGVSGAVNNDDDPAASAATTDFVIASTTSLQEENHSSGKAADKAASRTTEKGGPTEEACTDGTASGTEKGGSTEEACTDGTASGTEKGGSTEEAHAGGTASSSAKKGRAAEEARAGAAGQQKRKKKGRKGGERGEEGRGAEDDDAEEKDAGTAEGAGDKEAEDSGGEAKPTKRVLRARGISSYTEQLFSDESSDEEQLVGWPEFAPVYKAPGSSLDTSAASPSAKAQGGGCRATAAAGGVGGGSHGAGGSGGGAGGSTGGGSSQHHGNDYTYDESDEEDSDQDWILPSSRKRKNKRPSASRRLKSFQHKIQNIKVDTSGIKPSHHAQQPSPTKDSQKSQGTTPQPTCSLDPNLPSISSSSSSSVSDNSQTVTSTTQPEAAEPDPPTSVPLLTVKNEFQDPNTLHSVLDIKDEGPIYDPLPIAQNVQLQPQQQQQQQPGYVVVTSSQAPIANYYVMQQNPPITGVMQQNQFIQPTLVPQMVAQPSVQPLSTGDYYIQPNPAANYMVQNSSGFITAAAPRPAYMSPGASQVVYHQTPQGYVQYVTTAPQAPIQQPRIINSMTLTPPRQVPDRSRVPRGMPLPRQPNMRHPNGAVIRSAPLAANMLRPGQRIVNQRPGVPRQQTATPPRQPVRINKSPQKSPAKASKTVKPSSSTATSLIVLSDDDDEIEMIIPAKTIPKPKTLPAIQPKPAKSNLPEELQQRVKEGDISISPIKPAQPAVASSSTKLVVVVNETGSHYALALPNGSKLILTPEQVAQLRASNGGKLVL